MGTDGSIEQGFTGGGSDMTGTGQDDFTLDELTELALAADPDAEPADDVQPLGRDGLPVGADGSFPELLPSWYMPVPGAPTPVRGWRVGVVSVVIAAFGVINALGLCITYGQLTIA